MNIGITTSFLIGGLLLLAMLQLNFQVIQESAEVTLDMNDKNHVEVIRRIIKQDFNRIGYGDGSKIKSFNPPHFINFSADVYDQGTSEIIWHFKENVQVHETSNPDDRVLQRNGPIDNSGGSKPTKFRVVDFTITGYKDIQGKVETTDKNEVKSFTIKIIYEAPESVSLGAGEKHYPKAIWQKHIVPNNLQVNRN